MSINDIVKYNKEFVESKKYEKYHISKFPKKKIAVLTCMDARLTQLLPAALNFKNGDVKIIKNAGALISHPFGSVMRSLLIAIYDLDVEKILVIGHYDCGVQSVNPKEITEKMLKRGVSQEDMDFMEYMGCDVNEWFKGFEDPAISVKETVNLIKKHPLIPKDVFVGGYLMDPDTGRLDEVIGNY